jgi:anti-sigma-K factor RskA
LKKFNRLFQEAERLAPPPDLWKRIEAKSPLASGLPGPRRTGRAPHGAGFWGAPALRAAAAVVLAVGVLGLGVMLQKRMGGRAAYADSAATAASAASAEAGTAFEAGRESEIVDPELLVWHADLGELNDEVLDAEEAGEAGEML